MIFCILLEPASTPKKTLRHPLRTIKSRSGSSTQTVRALPDHVNPSPEATIASQNAATRRLSTVNMSCTKSKCVMEYFSAIARMSRRTRAGERSLKLRLKKSLVEQNVQGKGEARAQF